MATRTARACLLLSDGDDPAGTIVPAVVRAAGAAAMAWQVFRAEGPLRFSADALAATRSAGYALFVGGPDDSRRLRRLYADLGVTTGVTRRNGIAVTATGDRVPVDITVFRDYHNDVGNGVELSQGSTEVAALRAFLTGDPGLAQDAAVAVSTRSAPRTRRLVRGAVDHARGAGRRRVTAVHKGNALKHTDGLLYHAVRDSALQQSAASHAVQLDSLIVDHMCAELVRHPEAFDVVLAPALYADILDAVLTGLLGPAAVAEVGHGDGVVLMTGRPCTAPAFTALGTAAAAALLLEHAGWAPPADRIRDAVRAVAGRPDISSLDAAAAARDVLARLGGHEADA